MSIFQVGSFGTNSTKLLLRTPELKVTRTWSAVYVIPLFVVTVTFLPECSIFVTVVFSLT